MADLRALQAALRSVMMNGTDAGARVSTALPERPDLPYITYQTPGGPGAWASWAVGEVARMRTLAWSDDEGEAADLHTQIRNIWLPAQSNPVQGYVGVVNVTIGGQQRTVHIDGVRMDAGPNPYLDPPTQLRVVECYWLVDYW
jgi:hypothetical protein